MAHHNAKFFARVGQPRIRAILSESIEQQRED